MKNKLQLNLQFFASEQTKKADLINPEVLANVVGGKLEKEIRFSPYAVIDNTLVGQPGDTITRPNTLILEQPII